MKLHSNKLIHAFWTLNRSIKLKVSESGKIHVITCDVNLEKLIPNDEIIKDIQRVWVLFIRVGFVFLN